MSWNSRKNGKVTNILLVLICIALIVVLGGLFVTNHKEVQQESQRLKKLSEKQETGIEDYESVKEHASELEEVAADEADKSAESGDAQNTDKSGTESKDSEKK